MKRVLFLAYFFPPAGGSGVQRSSKFVRYLPENGYEPIVVTGPGETGGRWTPPDTSIGSDVPDGVTVLRVPGPVPHDGAGLRWRVRRFLRAPSVFDRWWSEGAFATARGCRDVSVVYASMSPFSSAAPAARLARELGVPWVADLRDPWAVDEYFAYPTFVHWALERRRMGQELSSAALIVLPTPGCVERVSRFFPQLADRVIHIPNGFDPADFTASPEAPDNDAFRIVHAGYSYGDVGRRTLRRRLGGTDVDVDLRPRSGAFLLAAVDRLVARETPVQLHLAGPLTESDEALIRAARSRGAVVRHGYLPHTDAVRLMQSADALFLPMHRLVNAARSTIVPGKLYEYLASGRPIVAAIPDGDARDIVDRAAWATHCEPTDAEAIAAALEGLLETTSDRRGRGADRTELLRRYERPRLAADLASALDRVIGLPS